MRKCGVICTLIAILIPYSICSGVAQADDLEQEPDYETALSWWPEMTNVWTPMGWRNHLFRFNVFYGGWIMADPQPEKDIKLLDPWAGLGVQLDVMPSENGLDPYRFRGGTFQMSVNCSRRTGYQGLLDHPTPVLWTEWRQQYRSSNGAWLRKEFFAHVPGGEPVETGTEPLYGWVRLSVVDVNPLVEFDNCGFLLRINAPHIYWEMYEGRNLMVRQSELLYPRELHMETFGDESRPGAFVLEPDGKVRLAVLEGSEVEITFQPPDMDNLKGYRLHVSLPARQGAYVDLLLPFLSQPRADITREMALGREAALAECDRYWSAVPDTAARIVTPEPRINEFLRRSAQYGELIAQKMPDTGHYTNLTGSMVYARMWATPTTMFDTMLLDTLGYHVAVDRYLEILRTTQGTVKPPGPAFERHPGYLATPLSLTALDWLSDHGAVLHAACYHALITDDQAFIARWLDPILLACEFIRESRAKTNHEGVKGVIPPAVATDRGIPTQAVWNIGWHYKGLTSAVALLDRLNHPRADEFRAEADEFKRVFVKALREATEAMPTWTDRDGNAHHIVPTSLSAGGDVSHAFYLDTGPLFLVYAGLLDADDPLMRSTLKFFREGPNTKLFDPHGHHEQPAILVHEISSCEPPASFNLFHSHQLGDRVRWLEGMYSMIAGAHSRNTFTGCETRNGITGLNGHINVYAIKLSVIDDELEEHALHLLRLVPKAWIKEDQWTVFEQVPTLFGPVDLRFQLGDDGQTLRVQADARFRHAPQRITLHCPPVEGLKSIELNGARHAAQQGSIDVRPSELNIRQQADH